METLRYGHKPVLIGEVPQYEKSNNRSFFEHQDFALTELDNLIKAKKVEIVSKPPYVVNPLSVAVQPSKNRLVLDCSFLNKFILVPSFKMDDHKVALSFVKEGVYLFSFDMKDGYHHLAIHADFRDYLGFKFTKNGKVYYGRFCVAPFGLRDIPYIFTKILRPLVAHWRRSAIACCLYLDDGLGAADSYDKALKDSIHVRQDLIRAGIVWSIKKSVWIPVQKLEWLGFEWNTLSGSFKIKERRVIKLKETCLDLSKLKACSARRLAGFVGQVISMLPVIGNIARLMSRSSQIGVAIADDWDSKLIFSSRIVAEFSFWISNIDRLNEKVFTPSGAPILIDLIEGDASATGCGSILNNSLIAAKCFSESERKASSTWRELANILFSLSSFIHKIKGRTVKFLTDCQPAVRVSQVGSMNPILQELALNVFELCFSNGIELLVSWIPREENERADAVSR